LDINKIGKLIGTENIEIFIEFIDKKGTKNIVDFIGEFTQENKLENISKRVFCVYGDFSNKNFLREQLINSDKNPIIPGSSVKGAIRTAIISYLVGQNKQIVRRIIDKEQINKPFATWKEKDFQKVETKILNKLLSGTESIEANKNTMRF
jgi:CRISPR type III-A-associated RAMP protein Csm5